VARRSRQNSAPREFTVLTERDTQGWLVASVPVLRGCHSPAKSLDGLVLRIREVTALCLEVDAAPAVHLDFVGIQRVRAGWTEHRTPPDGRGRL
jgi:predicted RNase H-like HicB family nuclease